jgi:uncharacterized protein YceK
MRIILIPILLLSSISLLSGCGSMAGNVIPATGPTMENVYDSMETRPSTTPVATHVSLPMVSKNMFTKLPNPELKMYVYPHFAGKEGVPIPGYYTVFNAYEKDHYMLPSGTTGIST